MPDLCGHLCQDLAQAQERWGKEPQTARCSPALASALPSFSVFASAKASWESCRHGHELEESQGIRTVKVCVVPLPLRNLPSGWHSGPAHSPARGSGHIPGGPFPPCFPAPSIPEDALLSCLEASLPSAGTQLPIGLQGLLWAQLLSASITHLCARHAAPPPSSARKYGPQKSMCCPPSSDCLSLNTLSG